MKVSSSTTTSVQKRIEMHGGTFRAQERAHTKLAVGLHSTNTKREVKLTLSKATDKHNTSNDMFSRCKSMQSMATGESDGQLIQPDNKLKIWTRSGNFRIGHDCVATLHDADTNDDIHDCVATLHDANTNDDMTIFTDFHNV